MKSEIRRLNKLKDESRNLAKRYKLPAEAVKIIERAGRIHGQQSRAIQVAVELIWNSPGKLVDTPPEILDSPITGKTYKLPPRTVGLINGLANEYGTKGHVLAACAFMLSKPDPRTGLSPAPPIPTDPTAFWERAEKERKEREAARAAERGRVSARGTRPKRNGRAAH